MRRSRSRLALVTSLVLGALALVAGVTAARARPIVDSNGRALWPLAAAGAVGVATFGLTGLIGRRRRKSVGAPA